jgi:hypothetical protein
VIDKVLQCVLRRLALGAVLFDVHVARCVMKDVRQSMTHNDGLFTFHATDAAATADNKKNQNKQSIIQQTFDFGTSRNCFQRRRLRLFF